MKKTMLLIVFAAMMAGNAHAQNNNPKREVLLTLAANEEIVYDEYALGVALNGYKFAAIVKNTRTSKFSLIFNGKRVCETKEEDWHGVPYLDPGVENGYAYCYTLDGRGFSNVMGKVTTGTPEYFWSSSVADNGKFAFGYEENDKWYANIDGTIFGPYQSVYRVAIADNGKFAFGYQENDKWYANIDGTIFGPYQIVGNVAIADNGKFAFGYRENDEDYANMDGTIFGPYPQVYGVAIAGNGKFAFEYSENGERHYNVNGEEAPESAYDMARAETRGTSLQTSFHAPREKIINDIKSNDGKHAFYSDWECARVVIDGKEVGEHPAFHAWYDADKHAFVWNAIEDRELVVYEYKL
jgi:hypothetical protein